MIHFQMYLWVWSSMSRKLNAKVHPGFRLWLTARPHAMSATVLGDRWETHLFKWKSHLSRWEKKHIMIMNNCCTQHQAGCGDPNATERPNSWLIHNLPGHRCHLHYHQIIINIIITQASDPQFYGQCHGQEATFTKVRPISQTRCQIPQVTWLSVT